MKICFCSYSIPKYKVGGAERQMFNMAKELVERGHEVHMTTKKFSDEQPWDEEVEGVKVHAFTDESKFKIVSSYLKALNRADADIYHNRVATSITGLTALFAKLKRRKFVYTMAHEKEFSEEFIDDKLSVYRKYSYLFGIRNAERVVTLSKDMKKGLKEKIGIDSEVIYSGYRERDPPEWEEKEDLVVWIGRFVEWKRPEKFLELADKVEDDRWRFALIGFGDEEYEKELKDKAEDIDNLDYVGEIEPGDDWEWYRKAKLVVNTSTKEGFPNTFIQSWMMGTPVASLEVDPDGFIEKNDLGVKGKIKEIRDEIVDNKLKSKGEKARKVFEDRFRIEETVEKHLERLYR